MYLRKFEELCLRYSDLKIGVFPVFLCVLTLTFLPVAFASPQLWQSSSSGSQNFGAASSLIHRIEDLLSNSQKSLSNSDYFDFQSRLYTLKHSASLELSRGADASTVIGPLQSLENEIQGRTKEFNQMASTKRTQLEASLTRLEALLKSKSEELSQQDWSLFFNKLADLRSRANQNTFAADEILEGMYVESRELESKIMDKVMFAPHRGSLTFTRDDDKSKSENKSNAANSSLNSGNGNAGASNVNSRNVKDGEPNNSLNKPTAQTARTPKKPPVPIPKLMEHIENQLIDFHEKHQIGSFDMDSFTERLLAQKRNLHVMMSKTGRISARQEIVIRQELEQLEEDLTSRVSGKE
jgi:hypothetical protein